MRQGQKAQDDSVMEFPCRFPIKVMGRTTDDFDALVVSIIRKYAPEFNDTTVKSRLSKKGRYISITVTIDARSREQLDNIYRDLSSHQRVLFAI